MDGIFGESAFLSLDKAIASRAVALIVIVSGSDGNAFGANKSKAASSRRYVSMGELIRTHGRAIEWAYPQPARLP